MKKKGETETWTVQERGRERGGEAAEKVERKKKNQERERDRERGIRRVNIGKVREELSSSLERDMLPLSELIIILNKS